MRLPQKLAFSLISFLLASAATASATLPSSPEGWRRAAQADIEAAVQVTRDNHPGPHDPHNPGFRGNLEAARTHGLALAAQVRDAGGYLAALGGFNARIGDGHAGVAARIDTSVLPRERWPGFTTVWRGDALYVHSALEGGQPAVGSKLVGCDGKVARQLILDNVFAFQGRADEAGRWWSSARRLFIDGHNPFIALPQRCRFELNGVTSEHVLSWRPLDAEAERWLEQGDVGTALPVGMTEPRKNLYWVAMPTFHPNEAERAAYRALVRDVKNGRAGYLSADAIVVDLRGNRGGSSMWSHDFARALLGEERVSRAMMDHAAKTEVWWRASPGNTAHLNALSRQLAREGSTEAAAWAGKIAAGMRKALARGQTFHVESWSRSALPAPDKSEPAPYTRPLYVIVPGNCASACLDALDVFTRFPNTVLVGAPSSADSTYMDVRFEKLPSGLAEAVVPNKVYVNRGRGNGQVYQPQLPVTAVAWSTEVLRQAVEAHLARGR